MKISGRYKRKNFTPGCLYKSVIYAPRVLFRIEPRTCAAEKVLPTVRQIRILLKDEKYFRSPSQGTLVLEILSGFSWESMSTSCHEYFCDDSPLPFCSPSFEHRQKDHSHGFHCCSPVGNELSSGKCLTCYTVLDISCFLHSDNIVAATCAIFDAFSLFIPHLSVRRYVSLATGR